LGELLLRLLDGRLSGEERSRVEDKLRGDPAARDLLRSLAEQSVMVADVERMALGREQALRLSPGRSSAGRIRAGWFGLRPWKWAMTLTVAVVLLAAAGGLWFSNSKPWVARVARVTGSSQFFGSRGELQNTLEAGSRLGPGDTLETRSCDGWIEIELRDGARITMGGHSIMRILQGKGGGSRFDLARGSLWASPARDGEPGTLEVTTGGLTLAASRAQFDLQTSPGGTMLRVNKGEAKARRSLDGSFLEISAGSQMTADLGRKEPLSAQPQPEPVAEWSANLGRVPEVILGRWLPSDGIEGARLGAAPLLWPIPGREPVMLYAVALPVASSSEHPVLVGANSVLRFRGRTKRPQQVRFGFTTQKMRGVYAGKFEMDERPESPATVGAAWEVVLSAADFRPLQPQLSLSPEGLEVTDVYALTIKEDAGLEINQIEFLEARPTAQAARR
jgi:ferric-dicitrate binding protein FerR (iron transport regulator)